MRVGRRAVAAATRTCVNSAFVHVLADLVDQVRRQHVVVVVGDGEPPATTGERAQVDGVAEQLALGHQGVDHLLAAVALLGALHLAAA